MAPRRILGIGPEDLEGSSALVINLPSYDSAIVTASEMVEAIQRFALRLEQSRFCPRHDRKSDTVLLPVRPSLCDGPERNPVDWNLLVPVQPGTGVPYEGSS